MQDRLEAIKRFLKYATVNPQAHRALASAEVLVGDEHRCKTMRFHLKQGKLVIEVGPRFLMLDAGIQQAMIRGSMVADMEDVLPSVLC